MWFYDGKPDSRSRAPHGARGLKPWEVNLLVLRELSRPAWGAWIETPFCARGDIAVLGRAPHGARGLKLLPLLY